MVTSVLAKRFVADGHHVAIASLEQPHPELKDQTIEGVELAALHHPVLAKDNVVQLHQVIVDKKIDIIVNQWEQNCWKKSSARKPLLLLILHSC